MIKAKATSHGWPKPGDCVCSITQLSTTIPCNEVSVLRQSCGSEISKFPRSWYITIEERNAERPSYLVQAVVICPRPAPSRKGGKGTALQLPAIPARGYV